MRLWNQAKVLFLATVASSTAWALETVDHCKAIVSYQSVSIPGSNVGITLALDSGTGLIRLVEVTWIETGIVWDTSQIFSYFKDENKFYFGKPLKYQSGYACKGTGCNPMHSAKTTSSFGVSHARNKVESAMMRASFKSPEQKIQVQRAVGCTLQLLQNL